jgi:membrane protein implicated in regulation of membrane protease activity
VGQAKVLGKVRSVKTDNPPLKEGDTVRVLAVDGVKLIVEKVF